MPMADPTEPTPRLFAYAEASGDGRAVYLCWLIEEPEIGYWHELRGGYTGRRPL